MFVLLYSKYKIFEEGINQLAVVSFEVHIAVTRKIISFHFLGSVFV
jgi:hypothetical protein